MGSNPEFLSLEEIKAKYPPVMEFLKTEGDSRHEPVSFFMEVCRDEDFTMLWSGRAYVIAPPPLSNPPQKSEPAGQ